MCLIIHRPAGCPTVLPLGWLDDFWSHNSDGFGAWWVDPDNREIVMRKTMNKGEVLDIVREIEGLGVEAGMHWRMATHGEVSLVNCHPFVVNAANDGRALTVLAHNGVLAEWFGGGEESVYPYTAGKQVGPSDTSEFVRKAFKPLVHAYGLRQIWTPKTPGRLMLEAALGSTRYNRLLLTNFRLGWARAGDTWTEWRGMFMSNNYAWKHEQRDREDGPAVPVPFARSSITPSVQGTPGIAILSEGLTSQSVNGNSCGKTATSLRPGILSHTMGGRIKYYVPPDDDTPYHRWLDEDQFLLWETAQDLRDARKLAEIEEAQLEGELCAWRKQRPEVTRAISEGTGPNAAHKPVGGEGVTTPDEGGEEDPPFKASGNSGNGAGLVNAGVSKPAAAVMLASAVAQEAMSIADETGQDFDEITLDIIARLPYAQVVEWCQEEPEEAAWLLQGLLEERV